MRLLIVPAICCGLIGVAQASDNGIAMHGKPLLAKNYRHYAYANPLALKGGTLRQALPGSFDSLNPFSIRGNVARNIRERVFESLLDRHYNEGFALYALLADSVTTPDNRRSVTFTINKKAKFSDGAPVTAADVKFSLEILREKGRPNHRYYYGKVKRIKTPSAHRITFYFDKKNLDRELPLIIALMPILPRHIYAKRDIQKAGLGIPIGSGPYRVEKLTPGTQVRFARNKNHWAAELPANRGKYNFALLIDDYYRDDASAFESFKTGESDIWVAHNAQRWQSGFDFPAAKDGRIVKATIKRGTPSGLRGLVLNTRRPVLAKKEVRRALDLMFDFEWVNKVLYDNAYQRTLSYFGNTPLSGSGKKRAYRPPQSDGSGRDRKKRTAAIALLESAGFTFKQSKLLDAFGKPVKLEIIVQRRGDQRLALSWQRMLAQIGIDLSVRLLDSSQYQRRLQNFDFDIIIYDYYASLSPGNEQAHYWGSAAADTPGSRNYAGIKNPKIDAAIAALTSARSVKTFQTAARTLDYALMNGAYFVPLYHNPVQWVAHWQHIKHPKAHSLYGARFESWWSSK